MRSTNASEGSGPASIEACRSFSRNTIFVIGPARSGTTIVASLINSDQRALVMTEANFYQCGNEDFREYYNNKPYGHFKGFYAPEFCIDDRRSWIDWLLNASSNYDFVGDKVALTYYHFEQVGAPDFISFYEKRFFQSKYVWTLRDPIQAIISTSKLINCSLEIALAGWLTTASVWANFICIFPHTFTLFHEDMNEASLKNLANFLNLDIAGGMTLFDKARCSSHVGSDTDVLKRHSVALGQIYSAMRAAASLLPGRPRPVGLANENEAPADTVRRLSSDLRHSVLQSV